MKGLFSSLFFLGAILFMPLTSLAWECDVILNAPPTIKLDQTITLTADGTPTGGSYSWSRTPNLTPAGNTATLIGHKPSYSEYIQVIAYYKTPKGKTCKATKWIWACVCNVTTLNGPAMAKIDQPVTLSAEAEPTGGTYTWTIESGTGTLTPSDSSAEFIGDQAGPVEIKVSYVPPDGGKPCVKYHTIEIEEECAVTLTGIYQRPICQEVDFSADGTPADGTCSWTSKQGMSTNGCNAVYNTTNPGHDTVTVNYTPPNGGNSCPDSKNVISYEYTALEPLKPCYNSGDPILLTDFNVFNEPDGFKAPTPVLSPTIAPILKIHSQYQVGVAITSYCDPGSTNEAKAAITVVNKDVKSSTIIKLKVPDYFNQTLKTLGLADALTLQLSNNYSKSSKCCIDGAKDSAEGKTALGLHVKTKSVTLAGIPVPPALKRYVTIDALAGALSANGNVIITGTYAPCTDMLNWKGDGTLSAGLTATAELSLKASDIFVIKGAITGTTGVTEKLTVKSPNLVLDGKFDGLTVGGEVVLQVKKNNIVKKTISHTIAQSKVIPQVSIPLPSMK